MNKYFLLINLILVQQTHCMQWLRNLFSKKPVLYKDLSEKEKSELIGAPNDKRLLTDKQKRMLENLARNIKANFVYFSRCDRRASIVKSAIKKHKIHPNCVYLVCEGRSPLCDAVYCNDKKYAQFLLTRGADPDELAKVFSIPMPLLTIAKDIDCVKLLLDYKANPNARGLLDSTPLVHAMLNKNKKMREEIVRLLIQHGALLSIKFSNLSFPQHVLAQRNKCLNSKKSDESTQKQELESLSDIRLCAIEEQKKRRQPLDLAIKGCLSSYAMPLDIIPLIQTYCYDEPDYEELEKEPLPKKEKQQKKEPRKKMKSRHRTRPGLLWIYI